MQILILIFLYLVKLLPLFLSVTDIRDINQIKAWVWEQIVVKKKLNNKNIEFIE